MSGEIEAAGALATAGLAARELDRQTARKGHLAAHDCQNCGAALTGPYCAACGQPGHIERKLSHAFEELLHGLIHFDSKAWRTLPLLAFRPGTLTRNYIHGMRVRYIPPVALFLFTVFLMFFVFALMGEVRLGSSSPQTLSQLRAEVVAAERELAEARNDLAKIDAELAVAKAPRADPGPGEIAGLDGQRIEAKAELDGSERVLSSAKAAVTKRETRIAQFQKVRAQLDKNETDAKAKSDEAQLKEIATARAIIDRALADPLGPQDAVRAEIGADGRVNVNIGVGSEDGRQTIFRQIKEANARGAIKVDTGNPAWDKKILHKLENPEFAWYKIQNTAYKFSFLLVPISLPFIWLMFFWKRGVTLYDHAVFALYSLSFMSLLFVAFALLARTPAPYLEQVIGGFMSVLAFAIPAHIFFHIKGAYALGWFSAFWRTCVMIVFACLSLSFFVGAIFMLGLLG
jgi:hypothetical protein